MSCVLRVLIIPYTVHTWITSDY